MSSLLSSGDAGKKYYKGVAYSRPNVIFLDKIVDRQRQKVYLCPVKSEGDGEVAERLKAPLSKSGILSKNGIVGSNPTLSAMDVGLNDDPPV